MPPPMIPTMGSSEIGVVKLTCSCLSVFFRTDLLEAPCFLPNLGEGLRPSAAARFLGGGGGLGWEEQIMVRGLWVLRGWRRRGEWKEQSMVVEFLEGERDYTTEIAGDWRESNLCG